MRALLITTLLLLMSKSFVSAQVQDTTYGRFSFKLPENLAIVKKKFNGCEIRSKDSPSWLTINLLPYAADKGDLETDFKSDWVHFVACCYDTADRSPSAFQLQKAIEHSIPKGIKDSWKYQVKAVTFFQHPMSTLTACIALVTFSGFGEYSSMTIITDNVDQYTNTIEMFLNSLALSEPPKKRMDTVESRKSKPKVVPSYQAPSKPKKKVENRN